jgi:predicted MFS family arabinose efflux permease
LFTNLSTTSPAINERALLFTLAGIQFTHILDFMIMMPLGPQFTSVFGLSDAQFGLLVSAYSLSAAVSAVIASTYIDRFERKRLLLTLYIAFGLATIACGLAPSYGWLMVARLAAGFFGGVLAAMTNTIIGDVVPFERRGEATGYVMRSFAISTVAGVPASLFIASQLHSWRAPFLLIGGLVLVLAALAARSLPRLTAHLARAAEQSAWQRIRAVLADGNHWRAYVFVGLMMMSGFTLIPYITIYTTTNVGLTVQQIPLIYLCGGVATFFTARYFGQLADRLGKVRVYRWVAGASVLPMLAISLLPPVPLWVAIIVTTGFFICVSGRMVPGMAIVTSAAEPALRGTYMTLSSAVQSAASGLAAFVGGAIIARAPNGQVLHYGWVGALAVAFTLVAMIMVGKVSMYSQPKPQQAEGANPQGAAAKI